MGASLLALAKSIYYYDRKPRVCQKLGNGPGLANGRPPGSAKFANAPLPGLTVARGEGAGRRRN